jgi:hypothetical protein
MAVAGRICFVFQVTNPQLKIAFLLTILKGSAGNLLTWGWFTFKIKRLVVETTSRIKIQYPMKNQDKYNCNIFGVITITVTYLSTYKSQVATSPALPFMWRFCTFYTVLKKYFTYLTKTIGDGKIIQYQYQF